MTNPNLMMMILIMYTTLMVNLMTIKTSIMCMNLVIYTMMMSIIISMKIKLTPIPFIVFLTMIGGLMIIFLYFTATMWMKKETLTMKTKIMLLMTLLIPTMIKTNHMTHLQQNTEMILFDPPFNKMTILMMILLTIMLMFMIEIHMKANSPFRRKLKIWG